uniref:Alpha-type protein kinase domain-containing protein n=1 Tax=Panagrolaimus sp. ES5 TaxID=591445 RepID=A0AC34EZU3_9BILA
MSNIASWMAEEVDSKPSAWTHERKSRRNCSHNSETVQLREMNKRLRAIYEESGLNYGEDVTEVEITERFRKALDLRKQNVKNVLRHIQKARDVEICFLVDATGSMQSYINGVRKSIMKIVNLLKLPNNTIKSKNTANKLRLSVVAYRDVKDQKRFEILNFTESVEEFQKFCSSIIAEGGDDSAEDVFGGIHKALNLEWREEYGTKVIFHIADAPCHGKKYHDLDDYYPNGDPEGKSEVELFKQICDKNIDYYFGKINASTNKMIDIFSQAYGKHITDFNITDVLEITSAVFTAVSKSVHFSAKVCETANISKVRSYVFDKDIPVWNEMPKLNGRFLNYEMPETIEDVINDVPLIRNPPKRASIQVAENPFDNGSERYAFYGRDITIPEKPENIVLKEYIVLTSGLNAASRYENTNQVQTVASFLAEMYNETICSVVKEYYKIKFLKVQTLCLPVDDRQCRYFSCEKQYGKDDMFVRFTNNADYAILESTAEKFKINIDFVWALTAFSHWTYQVTNKKLMVVDLQGIISKTPQGTSNAVLTDPAIHCVDETRFGRMNLGKDGMNIFFKRHECNKFCKALKLDPIITAAE